MIPPNTTNYYISYFDLNYKGVVQINLRCVVLSVCFSGWRFHFQEKLIPCAAIQKSKLSSKVEIKGGGGISRLQGK